LILYVWPISPTASLLLAPYILWVSIAWALNLAIVRLNPPFGAAGPAQPSDIRST
jgi:tryptophan-rich sensory protein